MVTRTGISKIVSRKQEELAGYDIVALTFAEAYAALRAKCPTGDLRIHLSVTADVPVCNPPESIYCGREDCDTCGNMQAFKAPSDRYSQDSGLRPLTRHERHQLAADHGIDTLEDYRGER